MAAAWIVEWDLHRPDLPVENLRPHILPWWWKQSRVLDYMRGLYWNSELWTPQETLKRVGKQKSPGTIVGGPRLALIFGDSTHLAAWSVRDLEIRQLEDRFIIAWTIPSGYCEPLVKLGEKKPPHHIIRKRFEWYPSKQGNIPPRSRT